ncbi:unnamed protein product [Soboliphyme baturini]|uniref:Peptidase S1 domain-containing protein n=1 Tax=Soboliphyme baturini TaxID=241478 RepID=A0A183JA05_9BILA|nr:unnamed protein product [Soboliphyme baturini]
MDINDYRIALGLHDFSTTSYLIRRLSNVTIHPEFGQPASVSNDIAILTLSETVRLTKKVQLACLPERSVYPGQLCVVTGWGVTEGKRNLF